MTELNNRLRCVLCTNMESFNIFQVLSIQASFKVQQKIKIVTVWMVCINLLERGLVHIHSRENFISVKCKIRPQFHLNSFILSSNTALTLL